MIRRLSSVGLGTLLQLPALQALPFRRRDSVQVARAERAQPKPQPMPLHTVRLPELGADLLLPATGATPEATLAMYRRQVDEQEIFSEYIGALRTEASPAFDPDQPVVGILTNEPLMLRGGGGIRELCDEMNQLGCRVLLIPPCADVLMPDDAVGRAEGIRTMVRRLDGLIGPGGVDIDPAIYGEKKTYTADTVLRRDRFEADFALTAKNEPLFMFAICRSHQLWNSADGGSLYQDIKEEDQVPVLPRQHQHGIPFDEPFIVRDAEGKVVFENRIELDPESRMADVTKETEFLTNANYHQAVKIPGVDAEVVGYLKDGSLIEATERWNSFTVQWHPEAMWSDPIQRRLLGTVARRAACFRAAKRLDEQKKLVSSYGIEKWYRERFGLLDASDLRWLRRDMIPQWFGLSVDVKPYATQGVYSR